MDREKAMAFVDQFTAMASHTTTIALLAIADRTDLLRVMVGKGGMTAVDIATEAELEERYVTEIAAGLAAAGVLGYDPNFERFSLSDEIAAVVADDTSPYAMVGWLDTLPATMSRLREIADATRHGGGVPFEEFGDDMVRGIDRGSAPSMRILLTRRWLPAMPDVVERLSAGDSIADVGCGSGAAAIAMATAYPASTIWGFDVHEGSIEQAKAKVSSHSNVHFEARSGDDIPTDIGFGLITTFDVIHDLFDPLGTVRRIREALAEGGAYLMVEPRMSARLEENLHARGALLYGISTLHCLTQSLAIGGAGLGAAWGPEKAEALCREAGFSSFEELPIDNPFSAFYRVGG